MAADTETEIPAANPVATPTGGGAFAALGSASRAKADAFLAEQTRLAKEQTRLAELQIEQLADQNAYELSHLRWRRLNDLMRGTVQIVLAAAAVLFAVLVAVIMWNASRASGLVVESFSTPPAFAAAGVSGEVLADDLTNAVGLIRDTADARSLARSEDVRQERESDIRVEIPETGVSVAQAWRYLKVWLGHERRLGGNLRDAGGGMIALTVALDGERAFTVTGPAGDLSKLEQQAAEGVFERVDPNNYVIWLSQQRDRQKDSLAAVERWAQRPGSARDRASALSLWAATTRFLVGDLPLAITRAKAAARIDPKLINPQIELASTALALGHDEDVLRGLDGYKAFHVQDQTPSLQGRRFAAIIESAGFERRLLLGDFAEIEGPPGFPWFSPTLGKAELAGRRHDPARDRAFVAEAIASGFVVPDEVSKALFFADAEVGDWAKAAAETRTLSDPSPLGFRNTGPDTGRQAAPLLAYALARAGDFGAAEAAIGATPLDCYSCLRTRGQVDALQGKWASADAWFARAIAAAPSIPFAYADRGEMLLRKGDVDAAIAQLTLANQRGPRFADALELWGEALAAKGQSNLALAKFEAAARLAPNWGRLHLKWGQALAKLGMTDPARRQIQIAGQLSLSPADRAELAAQSS